MLQLVKTNLQAFGAWLNNAPNKHDIRNLKYRMSANNSGVLSIEYEEVKRVVNKSDDD